MSTPRIESYRFGQIVIDGQTYTKDVIVLPEGVKDNWWREKGHVLHPQDLDVVFEAHPDVLVVGQGAYGRMTVPSETQTALEAAGIELRASNSKEACHTYNQLRDQHTVVAALHLTC